jgi:hypothetical protein
MKAHNALTAVSVFYSDVLKRDADETAAAKRAAETAFAQLALVSKACADNKQDKATQLLKLIEEGHIMEGGNLTEMVNVLREIAKPIGRNEKPA